MTFPEIVKTTLWDIIDEMSRSLSSFVKNPDKDFIRKRKLDFKKMMHLIISMESGSLNHELLKFFEYDSSLPIWLNSYRLCFLSTTFQTFRFCIPSPS